MHKFYKDYMQLYQKLIRFRLQCLNTSFCTLFSDDFKVFWWLRVNSLKAAAKIIYRSNLHAKWASVSWVKGTLSGGCQGKERTRYDFRKSPDNAIPEVAPHRLAQAVTGNSVSVFALGEIKLPVPVSSCYDKLISWLRIDERPVPHTCTEFRDGFGNEIDGCSEELKSCFSRFVKVRMSALVSACFDKKSPKLNNRDFWDVSFVRDVLWKNTVVYK